ncbi:MAG: branched-chain amino acid transporter AzlC [Rhodobacterales bacterium]|nr:MAG: branched-chain amino acid transporter AzlC [Rhodobacterales bacterium]
MTTTTTKSAFWQGFRDGSPFVLVVLPFAALFGVVATEAGLNILETMMFSVAVIAGAAQFTALQLMQENTPTLIVIVSALAVNLRMAMYSASLTPHLGAAPLWKRALVAYMTVDQSYACSIAAYDRQPDWHLPQKLAFFFGTCTPVLPIWFGASYAGALMGNIIPESLPLDFAVPITFLAMIGPMLRTPAHVAAALVSVSLALAFVFLPYNLGLLVAGFGGMMAGAFVELRTEGADQ